MSVFRVAPIRASTLSKLKDYPYEAALGSLGFEQRCREIPQALSRARTRAAVPFSDRKEASYRRNQEFFVSKRWELPRIDDELHGADWIAAWLRKVITEEGASKVAIDVSSMSRTRIAAVVETIAEFDGEISAECDLLYTPAEYRDPDPDDDPPVLSVEPVSGYYTGWWSDLDAPLHVIIGVGYELERASSAIDHLEPEAATVFIPVGADRRYLRAVQRANRALFDTQQVKREVRYAVADPFRCFHTLEAGVFRLMGTRRIALVPLGPKIFSACALAVGALHPDAVQVIRVTARERARAVDQKSDGTVYGIRLTVGPPRGLETAVEVSGDGL